MVPKVFYIICSAVQYIKSSLLAKFRAVLVKNTETQAANLIYVTSVSLFNM